MTHLSINNVKKDFGNFRALKGISLDVQQGEFVSFLGGSGCGKTTTLRIIAGFEHATSGTVSLSGTDISGVPPEKRNLGFVFQHYALFPNMTARKNIEFGLKGLGLGRRAIDERASEYLALVRMEEFGARYPRQLSGGQQQRVALARALARRPNVLLLDEPLSALDAKIRAHLRTEIRSIQKKLGITTLYVTHDQEEALSLSDRIMLMRDGEIEQIGTPDELYNAPKSAYAASFIGTANKMEASIVSGETGQVSIAGREFALDAATIRDATVAGAANPDGKITLVIRPERVSFVRRGDGDIELRGTVIERRFLGSVIRLEIGIEGAEYNILVDSFNATESAVPQDGERVTVYFSPADVRAYRNSVVLI